MSSYSVVYEFLVSKVSARRIPGDECNIIRGTRAWDKMRGLCGDESSISWTPQVVHARERLCVQMGPIQRVHER